ncbi:MAG: hypothetical protein CMJ75_03085 [Planctomycetaceae bacterium]|nr:hypothetical protein [Planctomycetaceae bacterium]
MTDSPPSGQQPASKETPTEVSVKDHLIYGLSLPERTLRSTSAVVAGTLRESAEMLVPQAFRSSTSYRTLIEQTLNFMAQNVGGVTSTQTDEPAVDNFVARKAVGSFIEMASLPLLHVSPMMVLALFSDIAYGSQTYLSELSDELKKQGVIDENTTIDQATDLLNALHTTTSTTAQVFDKPPLSIDGLKETIKQIKDSAGQGPTTLMPEAEIKRLWTEMQAMATREHVSMLDVSSTITMYSMDKIGSLGRGALSTIKVAGNMFDRHIIDHYSEGLQEIHQKGIYTALAESSAPYIDAVWLNFSDERQTITEDVVTGRFFSRCWQWLKSHFRRKKKSADP